MSFEECLLKVNRRLYYKKNASLQLSQKLIVVELLRMHASLPIPSNLEWRKEDCLLLRRQEHHVFVLRHNCSWGEWMESTQGQRMNKK